MVLLGGKDSRVWILAWRWTKHRRMRSGVVHVEDILLGCIRVLTHKMLGHVLRAFDVQLLEYLRQKIYSLILRYHIETQLPGRLVGLGILPRLALPSVLILFPAIPFFSVGLLL